MMTDKFSIGRRLASVRMQKEMSQALVARRAGLAASYLSRIERGKIQPTLPTVVRIARALRVGIEEITGPKLKSIERRGSCPITSKGQCLLDLIRDERRVEGEEGETYTPREIRLLRRIAAWMKQTKPDRIRALEIVIEDLTKAATDE